MDKLEPDLAQQSHWKRWTGDVGPFYRACTVYPFDKLSDAERTVSNAKKPDIEVTAGIIRQILRNLPIVLLSVLLIYVPATALGFISEGRLTFPITVLNVGSVGLLLFGVLVIWLYLIYRIIASPLYE